MADGRENKLKGLKAYTVIVADSGDIEAIKQHKPQDATTNPSLILKATEMPQYASIIENAVDWARKHAHKEEELVQKTVVKLFVDFGSEILKIVPGRVSTEVDARLSFDIEGSIKRAREYIALYEENGFGRERILVKLASTWEGIKAAEALEKEGIHCNMTLLFNLAQAIASAEAKVTLISPFVGRIFDWQKKKEGREAIPVAEDMGVKSVEEIFHYYKKFGYKTEIMGASFRNIDEILALAGCDLLTIAPALLDQLLKAEGTVPRKLNLTDSKASKLEKIHMDEKSFLWKMCEDEMASEKLFEGIRNFAKDTIKLEGYLKDKFFKGNTKLSASKPL